MSSISFHPLLQFLASNLLERIISASLSPTLAYVLGSLVSTDMLRIIKYKAINLLGSFLLLAQSDTQIRNTDLKSYADENKIIVLELTNNVGQCICQGQISTK